MAFEIREATEVHIPKIVEIWTEGAFLANGMKPTDEQFQSLAENVTEAVKTPRDSCKLWIAENDGMVIGWQSLFPCRKNPFYRHLHVESSTYTKRRSGVIDLGLKLLHTATDFSDCSSIEMIIGFVKQDNVASIRMMKRCGFQRVGSMPLAAETAASPREIWYYDATAARREV